MREWLKERHWDQGVTESLLMREEGYCIQSNLTVTGLEFNFLTLQRNQDFAVRPMIDHLQQQTSTNPLKI